MAEPLELPTVFSTERLCLRKPTLEDAQIIFDAYASDLDIPRYMKWVAHTSVDQTADFLKFCLAEWDKGADFAFVIERQAETDGPIGMITMHHHATRIGFGYVIARKHWNNGYISEALKHLVDWSLDQTGIYRAQAFCDIPNPASARVMEKAGMSFEGILKSYSVHPNVSEAPRDCRMYAKAG